LPTFEVVSVKPQSIRAEPNGPPVAVAASAARSTFHRVNATTTSLIQFAYDVRDFQVIGGREWARQDPQTYASDNQRMACVI
jgi:uncharacterized protein (TIGR03435 family)